MCIDGGENRRERWIGTNTDIEDQKHAVAALADLNRTSNNRSQNGLPTETGSGATQGTS